MSQASLAIVATGVDGDDFAANIAAALQAVNSLNAGPTAPSPTYPYQWWADTTAGLLKMRNAADSGWIGVGTLSGLLATVRPAGFSITHPGVTVGSTATLTVSWKGIWVQGTFLPAPGTAPVLNTATAAGTINALDTGAWAANTWYPLHVVCNDDGSIFGLTASLSATAPSLPTGCTRFVHAGYVRSTGTATLLRSFTQVGNFVVLDTDEDFAPLTGGTSTSFADIGLGSYVPPGVTRPMVYFQFGATSGAIDAIARWRTKGSTLSTGQRIGRAVGSGGALVCKEAWVDCDSSQAIQYAITNTTGTGQLSAGVVGYIDPRA